MNCDFTKKISQLIDNELSEEEAQLARAHLATCALCQRAHEDFLHLRGEIKAYVAAPDLIANGRVLGRILAFGKPTLWSRSVALPVPAFALLLIAFVSLGIWTAFLRQPGPTKTEKPEKVLTVPAPLPQEPQGALDLARFDKGERATLYKVRRTNQGDVEH